MNAIQAIRALGPIDIKNIRRDSLLKWLALMPIVMLAAVRWLVPWIAAQLQRATGSNLMDYSVLLMSFIALSLPLIIGTLIGFLLLDQRDDHTLSALQVTPLALNGYLAYRVAAPALVTLPLTMLMVWLSGIVQLSFWNLLAVSLAAAPFTPVYALFYGSVAQNKVQGFAINKGSSVIFIPVIIAYFVQSSWQYAFGVVPVYWPVKLFWAAAEGQPGVPLYLAASLLYAALLTVVLLRLFRQVMHRE